MANFRKNAINQVLFVMVDKTDFATVESAITKSHLSATTGVFKFFGVNHKDSAFTSLTPATAVSLVHSGIFKQMLTAAECVYDLGILNIKHSSCADQTIMMEFTEIASAVWQAKMDTLSAASGFGSAFEVMYSNISNIYVDTADISNILSKTNSRIGTMSDILSNVYSQTTSMVSQTSNINSKLISLAGTVSQIYLDTADISAVLSNTYSTLTSVQSDTISLLSLCSQLRVRMDWSTCSDLTSKIAKIVWDSPYSNFATASTMGSAIGQTKSMMSGLSNILSNVFVDTAGISDILSKVYVQTTSMISITSDMNSNLISFIGNWTSYASDVASAVWAHAAGASVVNRVSQIKAYAIGISDILSNVFVDTASISDILSKVYVQTTSMLSQTSNANSKLVSFVGNYTSYMSDIASRAAKMVWETDYSLVVGGNSTYGSRVLVLATQSYVSDVRSYLSNYLSTIHSDLWSAVDAIGAGAITASDLSDMVSGVWKYGLASQTGAGTAASHLERINSIVLAQGTFEISKVYSLVSDVHSLVAIAATASDVASKVWATGPANYSGAGTIFSALKSQIGGITATVSSDTMSDIAVEVWTHATGARVDSRLKLAQSNVSDILSIVTSAASDIISMLSTVSQLRVRMAWSTVSDMTSKISSNIWATVDASDIASATWAHTKGASALSLLSQLRVRAAYSTVSDLTSKISSHVWATVDASDIASAVWAHAKGTSVLGYGAVAASGASLIPGMSNILSAVYVHTTSILSQTSNANSKIVSFIGNYDSYMSDISSRVWGAKWDTNSVASSFGSAFEVLMARTSYLSDLTSQVVSKITGASWLSNIGSVFWNDASGLSDLASRTAKMVWDSPYSNFTTASTMGSVLGQNKSMMSGLSNILSAVYVDTADISNVLSGVSDILSKVYVQTTSMLSQTSNANSKLVSFVGNYTSYMSDIASRAAKMVWDAPYSNYSTASTMGSRLKAAATSAFLSDVQSYLSDTISKITVNAITANDISDIASAVWSEKYNVYSATASSFGSYFVAGVTATVDYGSVASAVWDAAWDTHSDAGSFGSAFEVLKDSVSNVNSFVGNSASWMSDIASRVWIVVDASDIASAVWAHAKGTSALGYGAVAASGASLIPGMSNILSAVYVQTTSMASQTSNANSKLGSFIGNYASYMSDIASRVWATTEGSNVISRVSDVYSYLSTMAAGVELSASAISDVKSAVNAALDDAFTDATALTANGLKDRIRTMKWILQNKMNVIKANGNTLIYKDDNAATGLSTAAALTSDATSVTRKRLA